MVGSACGWAWTWTCGVKPEDEWYGVAGTWHDLEKMFEDVARAQVVEAGGELRLVGVSGRGVVLEFGGWPRGERLRSMFGPSF